MTFTTIWFWADWHQIRLMASALAPRMPLVWGLIFVSSTIVLAAWEAIYRSTETALGHGPAVWGWCLRTAQVTAAAVVTIAAAMLMNRPAPGLVYKAF